MWPDLRDQLRVELEQIDELFASHARVLENPEDLEPDQVEISALAAFLHTLYCGIENCFRRIVVELGGGIPAGRGMAPAIAPLDDLLDRQSAAGRL